MYVLLGIVRSVDAQVFEIIPGGEKGFRGARGTDELRCASFPRVCPLDWITEEVYPWPSLVELFLSFLGFAFPDLDPLF